MTLKRLITVLSLGVVVGLSAFSDVARAQATAPSEQRAREGRAIGLIEALEPILDELELSESQKAEVRRIVETARAEVREMAPDLRQLAPRDRAIRLREKLRGVREQIVAVLDEDQKEAFEQRVDERRGAFLQGRRADNAPGTQPAGTQPSGAEARVTRLAQQFREAIDQLELPEGQKEQAVRIADDLRKQLRVLRNDAAGDAAKMRERAREIVNEARQELQEILTPEQQQKLRELMQSNAPRPDRPAPPGQPEKPADPMKPQDQPDKPDAGVPPGDGTGTGDGPRATAPPPPNVRVGQAAADFALEKLDGRPVQLSSFKGKVLVLLFGNYSSPTFRDRADDYEQLRKQFANRADFLIVYTRESHPVGGWEVERNKQANVLVEQPKSPDERKALARQAKQALKITIPIALDTMEDKTATDYGGLTTSAVIVGRDGNVAAYRTWADAHAVRRLLEEVLANRSAPPTTQS